MDTLYTSQYLKNLAKNKSVNESRKMFSVKDSVTDSESFDIFLSHSYLDKDEVEGLYLELTRMGFSVYVDWIIDPQLDRNNVTKATAMQVRKRLKSSKTLLLAISVNASVSKWMPWELGYVDGHTEKCAIIPVSKSENAPTSYLGVEYLSLYPFIKKAKDTLGYDRLFVIEEARKYVVLTDWLKGFMPSYKNSVIY